MLRFYLRIVARGLTVFWETTGWWRNILVVIMYLSTIVAIFNQRLGKLVIDAWTGFPYWYGLAALSLVLVYGFLKANHISAHG